MGRGSVQSQNLISNGADRSWGWNKGQGGGFPQNPPAPTPDWHSPGREQDKEQLCTPALGNSLCLIPPPQQHKTPGALPEEWPRNPWGSAQCPEHRSRTKVKRMECLCPWEQDPECHHHVLLHQSSTSISFSCHSPSLGCALPPAVWEVHSPSQIIKYVLGDNVSFMFKLAGLQSFSDSLCYSDKQVDPEMGITFHYVLICTPYGFSVFYLSKCYIAEENQKQQNKQNP